ncbi:retrovirus-related pol polyprotein from transposon TNT 1-94 [Tanacetum coccineum]
MFIYIDCDGTELGDLGEPTNYKAALLDLESDKWFNAMNVEMQSIKDNEVWNLVDLPPNGKTVGKKNMDVKTAFLNGYLSKEVYMKQPEGKGFRNSIHMESIPMQEKLRLSKSQGASTPAELKRMKNVPYASAMGSIMYVVRCTRPDVAFAQNITSRFQQNPSDLHWTTTGYVFVLNGGAADWKSAKQSIFATSSAEAEYIAAYDASKEAVWVRKFISGLGVVPTIEEPINGNFRGVACDVGSPDSWRWSLHPSGQFSVSAFRAIIDSKLLGLPTRANIDKRGIDIHSILCPFCEEQIEDEDHIFALCPFSRNIWDLIRKWWGLDVIPLDTALNVLEMADDGDLNFGEEDSALFDVVVLCAIWWIWRARNLLVFQAVKVNMINIIDDIIATSYLWIKNRAKTATTVTTAIITTTANTAVAATATPESLHRSSGRLEDLEIIQEEDTHPSIDTSLNQEEDDLEIDEPQSDIIPIRRSTRTRRPTDRMCLYIDAEEHELGDLGEPTNYKVALLDLESDKWFNAMNVEMQSIKDNEVWDLVDLPPNGKTVGIDYEKTFSPFADIRAIRILIAIAAFYDYKIWQMNVKTAFLNGYLSKEVYMKQPEDADDLKSQTGYVFVLNGGAVDWKSTKQSIFATSSAEAEYIAAYDASKEAVWVRKFIFGLGVVPTIEKPISMYCDNTGVITIANESRITKGAIHFRAKVHYLREVIEFGDIKLEKVHTDDNLSDPFTKALAFPKHSEHTRNIGMLPASCDTPQGRREQGCGLVSGWIARDKSKEARHWKKVVCSFHGSDGNLGVACDVGSPDSWRWSLHPSGQFSVSAFRAIIDSKLLGYLGSKLRCNNLVPGKINILAWRIRNYRLPTRANIDKRGIDIHSILCPFCEEQIEDEDHIFALCPFSRNIWDLIRKWWGLDVIPLDTALNVLEMADDGDLNFGEKISSLFDVVVLCAIWWIWRARNLLVFQAVKVNMINIIDDIIATSYLWIKNRAKCCSISWVDWCCNPSILCILL